MSHYQDESCFYNGSDVVKKKFSALLGYNIFDLFDKKLNTNIFLWHFSLFEF